MIWAKLAGDVLRWLRRRVRNHQDAEDLASETVWRAWRQFRGEAIAWPRLWAWALTTARNLLLNYRRDTYARRFLALHEGTCQFAATAREDAARTWGDFTHALEERLSVGERRAMAMLRSGVLSNTAIARAQGVSEREVGRVRAALARKAESLWHSTFSK